MRNKSIKSIAGIITTCLTMLLLPLEAQIPDDIYSPRCRVHQRIGMTDIEIIYSRPGLKGRKLFGEIIQEGEEWRTGANSATTIRFDDEIKLNGQKCKPGIYAIYTVPSEDKWEIVFNADIYRDPYEGRVKKSDVLSIDVPVIKIDPPVETFTIFVSDISKSLVSAHIDLFWGNTLLKIPVEVPNKWEK